MQNLIQSAVNSPEIQSSIASTALANTEGYAGSGRMMYTLTVECVGYWLDILANNGTIEDVREASEVMDHYAEQPQPSLGEEKATLIGELWNHETHGNQSSLDGHIEDWCAEVGSNVRYAIEEWLGDNA